MKIACQAPDELSSTQVGPLSVVTVIELLLGASMVTSTVDIDDL